MEFNLLGHSSCGMDLTDGALKSAQTQLFLSVVLL